MAKKQTFTNYLYAFTNLEWNWYGICWCFNETVKTQAMQYLIHDLLQLPPEERLLVVEKIISSIAPNDYELALKELIAQAQINHKPEKVA